MGSSIDLDGQALELRRLTGNTAAELRADQFRAIMTLAGERGRVLLVQRRGGARARSTSSPPGCFETADEQGTVFSIDRVRGELLARQPY